MNTPPVRCALCLYELDRWHYGGRAPMCCWCIEKQGPVLNPWLWELKPERVSPAARDVWEAWASLTPPLVAANFESTGD